MQFIGVKILFKFMYRFIVARMDSNGGCTRG